MVVLFCMIVCDLQLTLEALLLVNGCALCVIHC